MNTTHTHIYCNNSRAIRQLRIDDMHSDDQSGQFSDASDLCCSVCDFVIATLYVPKPRKPILMKSTYIAALVQALNQQRLERAAEESN